MTAISTKKKILFAIIAIALALVFLELGFYLLLKLPGYSTDGMVALGNPLDREGRAVFLTEDTIDAVNEVFDDSLKGGIFLNTVTHPDPHLIFRVRPATPDDESLRAASINSEGFRGDEFRLDGYEGKKILILGDSCAYGWSIDDIANTWAARLQDDLENRLGATQVFNLGQPGYSSFQSGLLFDRWFDRLQPDYLIYYGGWNDWNQSVLSDRESRKVLAWTMSPATNSLRNSHAYQFLAQTVTKIRFSRLQRRREERPLGNRMSPKDVVQSLSRIMDRAGETGCQAIFVLPPFSANRAPGGPRSLEPMLRYREMIAEALKEKALLITFEEMEPTDAGSPAFFVENDGIHPNERGAAIIARGLGDVIVELERGKGS